MLGARGEHHGVGARSSLSPTAGSDRDLSIRRVNLASSTISNCYCYCWNELFQGAWIF